MVVGDADAAIDFLFELPDKLAPLGLQLGAQAGQVTIQQISANQFHHSARYYVLQLASSRTLCGVDQHGEKEGRVGGSQEEGSQLIVNLGH